MEECGSFDNGEQQALETDNGVYMCWKTKKRETQNNI